jgi:hypothetical protein
MGYAARVVGVREGDSLPKRADQATKNIQLIRKSLLGLAKGLSALAPLLNPPKTSSDPSHRKLKLSPKVRALRKLQGQYMGHLRTLKPKDQVRVKALRTTKGYPAAVSLARKLAKA